MPAARVFLQWSLAGIPAVAAAVEDLAGRVQIEGVTVVRLVEEKAWNAHLGGEARVHVGPPVPRSARKTGRTRRSLIRKGREIRGLFSGERIGVDVDAKCFAFRRTIRATSNAESRPRIRPVSSRYGEAAKPHQNAR